MMTRPFPLVRACISCLALGTFLSSTSGLAAAKGSGGKYEISKFRFSRKSKGTERLVLEMSPKEKGGKPTVKLSSNPEGHEATVTVQGASLIGAIPEAMINDSYASKSHYLGPVTINAEELTNGFSIHVSLKDSVHNIDAFWLERPNRLVLDLFPTALSKRAGKGDRGVASRSGSGSNNILCFPAGAQVVATVVFSPKKGGANISAPPQPQGTPSAVIQNPDGSSEAIVCYPAASQLVAGVSFVTKNGQAWSNNPEGAAPVPPADPNAAAGAPNGLPNSLPNDPNAAIPPAVGPAASLPSGSLPNAAGPSDPSQNRDLSSSPTLLPPPNGTLPPQK